MIRGFTSYHFFVRGEIMQTRYRDFGIWVTADGRKIPISELDENHLKNIVNKYERTLRKIPIAILNEYRKRELISDEEYQMKKNKKKNKKKSKEEKTPSSGELEYLKEMIKDLQKRVEYLEKWSEL
jgi:predicted GIY-YIG superfamily endonuclease